MSSITTYCPSCGRASESEPDSLCPQCRMAQVSAYQTAGATANPPEILPESQMPENQMETLLPDSSATQKSSSPWMDLLWAFLIWGLSGAFLLGLDAALRLALFLINKDIPKIELSRGAVIFSLVITLVMQVAALIASWMFVTRLGKKPFWQTLGWTWHVQFKWVHAVALAILMFGLGVVLTKLLPHHETELEKILKMGFLIRLMVVVLAVAIAPLEEEVVYRGVIYSAVERIGGKGVGVAVVTFIFALVHVPQYWGSFAAIATIISLSLVLTLLRAWTGKLLPCVATHLVYNGVQAVLLISGIDKLLEPSAQPNQQTAMILLSWLGLI